MSTPAAAARRALTESGDPGVDLISAHATATPFNDAAEARGIASALGERQAREVAVHAFKAQVGHTLGAAGAIASLASLDALERGVLPATAGGGAHDPDAPAHIFATCEPGSPRVALKLASAFGGANAALVLRRQRPASAAEQAGRPEQVRQPWITRAARVSTLPDVVAIAQAVGAVPDKLARADAHVLWALAAIAVIRRPDVFHAAGVRSRVRG